MTTDEIKTLLNAATSGKWIASKETGVLPNGVVQSPNGFVIALSCASEADAEFIAAAPQIVRQLLDEIERLKGTLEAIDDVDGYDEYTHYIDEWTEAAAFIKVKRMVSEALKAVQS